MSFHFCLTCQFKRPYWRHASRYRSSRWCSHTLRSQDILASGHWRVGEREPENLLEMSIHNACYLVSLWSLCQAASLMRLWPYTLQTSQVQLKFAFQICLQMWTLWYQLRSTNQANWLVLLSSLIASMAVCSDWPLEGTKCSTFESTKQCGVGDLMFNTKLLWNPELGHLDIHSQHCKQISAILGLPSHRRPADIKWIPGFCCWKWARSLSCLWTSWISLVCRALEGQEYHFVQLAWAYILLCPSCCANKCLQNFSGARLPNKLPSTRPVILTLAVSDSSQVHLQIIALHAGDKRLQIFA